MPKTIKLKINSEYHRNYIINALANSGYKVWVERVEDNFRDNYFVCFEYEANLN